MPQRSNDFQKLLLLITHAIGGFAEIRESAMLEDSLTGERREVDILITTAAGGHGVCIAIEVTDRSRPADVHWIEQQLAKHAQLATDKLVLVSRSGFTQQARRKAKALKIDIADYTEAADVDWAAATSLLAGGTFDIISIRYECHVVVECDGERIRRERVDRDVTVFLPYRKEPTTIGLMARFFVEEPRIAAAMSDNASDDGTVKAYTASYRPQPGVCIRDPQGRALTLVELVVDLKYARRSTPVTFTCAKYRDHAFGIGSSADPSRSLHFVFAKRPDGTVTGRLLDAQGIRALTVAMHKA